MKARRGINPITDTAMRRTKLHDAVRAGDIDLVRKILAADANINVLTAAKHTPLYYAVTRKDLPMAAFLLSQGADVNCGDCLNDTPLHEAAWNKDEAMIQLLLANGAQVNVQDHSNMTPLYAAVCMGNVANVLSLIEAGATLDAKRSSPRKAPLKAAFDYHHQNIIAILIAKGAKITPTVAANPWGACALKTDKAATASEACAILKNASDKLSPQQVASIADRIMHRFGLPETVLDTQEQNQNTDRLLHKLEAVCKKFDLEKSFAREKAAPTFDAPPAYSAVDPSARGSVFARLMQGAAKILHRFLNFLFPVSVKSQNEDANNALIILSSPPAYSASNFTCVGNQSVTEARTGVLVGMHFRKPTARI